MTKGIMNTRNKQILVGLFSGFSALTMFSSGLLNLITHFINLTIVPVDVLTDICVGVIAGVIAYRLLYVMKGKVSKRWFGSKNLKLLSVYFAITAIDRFFGIHISINEGSAYKIFFILSSIYLSIYMFKKSNKPKKSNSNNELIPNKSSNSDGVNAADS